VVHTKNRGGTHLNKSFTVYTNDSKKKQFKLTVSGKVRAYVEYSPRYIRFTGKEGQTLSQTIEVLPFKEFPLHIKKVTAKEGKHLRFELKPLQRKDAPQGYQLTVFNTMVSAGSYRDTIILETDSKVKPKLQIPVAGRIRKAAPQAQKSNPK